MRSFPSIFLLIIFYSQVSSAQPASLTGKNEPDTAKLHSAIILTAFFYGSALVALNNMWYRNEPRSSFHFFNDGKEWLQMDKAGHLFAAYQMGRAGISSLRWGGVEEKKAVFYGGAEGLVFLTAVEIFDGFPEKWGFSGYDMLANLLGAGLVIGQELTCQEQRIAVKYSFHRTELYKFRPELLGSNLPENILKDYNGQTCWLSVNVRSFLNENVKVPSWLNIAFGVSAYGMTGGFSNPENIDGLPIPFYDRYRRFFLSLDVDMERIKTKSKILNTVFKAVNMIKIPFPALEYSRGKVRGKYLYF